MTIMNTEPSERELEDAVIGTLQHGGPDCVIPAMLTAVTALVRSEQERAATRMRERCVGVVRARKYYDRGEGLEDEDPHSDNNPDYIRAAIDERLEDVAHDLESLTLDGEKEQTRS